MVVFLAGVFLAGLAQEYNFSLFEYWPSDYAGHRQDHEQAVQLLETFDHVLAGLVETWDHDHGLILITSDHGNMEDLGTRRHTGVKVPCLLLGGEEKRKNFIGEGLGNLTEITAAIKREMYS